MTTDNDMIYSDSNYICYEFSNNTYYISNNVLLKNRRLHGITRQYYPDGHILSEIMYIDGKISGDEHDPSMILYYSDGNIKSYDYYINGIRHRDNDLPAHISFYIDNTIESEYYYKHGKIHRDEDKPSRILYYPSNNENKSIRQETYFYMDRIHRDNGPAIIDYYPDGSIKQELYCKDGFYI